MDVIRIEDVTKNGNRRVKFSFAGIIFPTRKLALKVKELYDKQQTDSERSESCDERLEVQQNDEKLHSIPVDGTVLGGRGTVNGKNASTDPVEDTGSTVVYNPNKQCESVSTREAASRSKVEKLQAINDRIKETVDCIKRTVSEQHRTVSEQHRTVSEQHRTVSEQHRTVVEATGLAHFAIDAATAIVDDVLGGSHRLTGNGYEKTGIDHLALKPESYDMKVIEQI